MAPLLPTDCARDSVGDDAIGSCFNLSTLRELYMQFKFIHAQETKDHSIYYNKTFAPVKQLAKNAKKRILVTGGAGFLGSHLVDRLMLMGHEVIVVDNFYTGKKNNIQHWIGHPHFECITHDITGSIGELHMQLSTHPSHLSRYRTSPRPC
jgi:UDP-glucuronate decarboxylase